MMTNVTKQWGISLTVFMGIAALSTALLAAQSAQRPEEPGPTKQLHQALSLAEHGDKQGAMSIALQLLQQNPKFVPAIKLKAMLLEESGRAPESAVAYEEALNLSPNDPDLLLKTGIFKLMSGDREQALKLLQRCTAITPADGDAQFYLAQAYHLNGQDQLALPAIRRSLKAEPNNPSVWQKYGELLCSTGDCAGGLSWLFKAQKTDSTLPRLDFDIAATDYKLMDLTSAAQYAARAVTAHPDDLQALQLLATINLKLARWVDAESGFKQLLAVKPNDVESLLGLGQCEVELKDYPAAIETLHSVLRLDPKRLLAHFYLSRAYAGLGKTEDAQHEASLHQLMMQQATFVRAEEAKQREGLIDSQARQLLTEQKEEAALKLFQEHFKGTSATPADAYVFVGKLYLFMGKTDDGLRCLHHALKLQPTVRGAHTFEGILALKLNDLARAEKEFQAELANDPNYQSAIAELGEVRYHQQRWSDAAELLARSKTMTPELLYMLCDAEFRVGKIEDANLNAEAAAAYAKNNPKLISGLIDLLNRNGQTELAKRLGE